jgi:hypothetical protein
MLIKNKPGDGGKSSEGMRARRSTYSYLFVISVLLNFFAVISFSYERDRSRVLTRRAAAKGRENGGQQAAWRISGIRH